MNFIAKKFGGASAFSDAKNSEKLEKKIMRFDNPAEMAVRLKNGKEMGK